MDRMEQFESVCSENEEKSLKDYFRSVRLNG